MDMQPVEPTRIMDDEKVKILRAGDAGTFALSGESLSRWKKFKYSGLALNCLIFLFALPVFFIFLYASSSFDIKTLAYLAAPCAPLYLYIMSVWRRVLAEHESRCLGFGLNEIGIAVRNSSGEKIVPWHSVEAIFPTVQMEYVIQTSDGNFYFPSDMQDASELYAQIKAKMVHREADEFEINTILAEGGNEQFELPAVAFLSAVIIGPLMSILSSGKIASLNDVWLLALPVVLAVVAAGYSYLSVKSSVKLLRCGKKGIVLKRDGERPQFIEWGRIRKVKTFGSFMAFETAQQTWFVNWIFFQPVAANRKPIRAGRLKELFVAAKDAQAKVKKIAAEKTASQSKLIS